MAQARDIIIEEDLVIKNGDFLVGDSDAMHIEHILRADRGQFRQWPLVGAGLQRELNGSVRLQSLRQLIRVQLKADNLQVQKLKIIPGDNLNIDLQAKRLK